MRVFGDVALLPDGSAHVLELALEDLLKVRLEVAWKRLMNTLFGAFNNLSKIHLQRLKRPNLRPEILMLRLCRQSQNC